MDRFPAQKRHECKSKGDCIYKNVQGETPVCVRPSNCSDWGEEV